MEDSMSFNVDGARDRALAAMRAGKWDIVEEEMTRYAAAVRAEERHRAIGEALDALKECGGEEGRRPVRECIAAIERLR
jgi:hypothetical protein